MKTLGSIQKTYQVFKTLAILAMILSFIWAGLCALGVFCCLAWHSTGQLPVTFLTDLLRPQGGVPGLIGTLLADFVFGVTDGLLFFFAHRYFKQELADGTPFTATGAEQVKRLGLKTIVMPLAAVILSAVIYECFGLTRSGDWGNGAAVVLGVALILFSLILRHGAELRESTDGKTA